ncbi:MAG: beta-galactosidase [Clostridia bacterium]|nr:beta-galactosidase [Clostridia bacterium]
MGVCYYPEHWPERMWAEDLDRMKENGIGTVRIGEFAWSKIEPVEGCFTFDFFDRFMGLCAEKGIRVIFGTPTATPPAWLTEAHPEVLNARMDGVLYRHGGRKHTSCNSPVYLDYCRKIVTAIAERYGHHPALAGWQIDNELNCETADYYAEADDEAFRVWCRERYGSLDALNEAWGTVFWNLTYTDWSQVHIQRPTVTNAVNPHMLLDYSRFISDSVIRFAALQAEILRKHSREDVFITTNGLFGRLDNHRLTDECLDVMTYDSYPNFAYGLDRAFDPKAMNDRGWSRALTEVSSVCPHFGIMEQQSGPGGWYNRMESSAPRPGQLSLWALQSVAHGADFVSFFRWRTCPFGTEIYWHGILDYDSRTNRRLREVKSLSGKLDRLQELCGADHAAAFGVLHDYDNQFDADIDVWHRRLAQASEEGIFEASQRLHAPYDRVLLRDDTPAEALLAYPVLMYPHPLIMTAERVSILKRYVEKGGTLIMGCRAGLKDIHGRMVTQPQPGLLRELTGTTVEDFTFASIAEETPYAMLGAQRLETPVFNDVLTADEGTKVLARYASSYYAGAPALTEKLIGEGRVLHFGAVFSRETARLLLSLCGLNEPFREWISAPEEVELVLRRKGGQRWLIALNYKPQRQICRLEVPCGALLSGESCAGAFTLPPYGVEVFRLPGADELLTARKEKL